MCYPNIRKLSSTLFQGLLEFLFQITFLLNFMVFNLNFCKLLRITICVDFIEKFCDEENNISCYSEVLRHKKIQIRSHIYGSSNLCTEKQSNNTQRNSKVLSNRKDLTLMPNQQSGQSRQTFHFLNYFNYGMVPGLVFSGHQKQ